MDIYHPQWDEYDKPRVRCPHFSDKAIGSKYCQKECKHLSRVIDRKYETLIECRFNDDLLAHSKEACP
jgi:hypothetical protein